MKILIIFILIKLLSCNSSEDSVNPYNLYKLTDYPDSKCLDGSSPSYYLSKSSTING